MPLASHDVLLAADLSGVRQALLDAPYNLEIVDRIDRAAVNQRSLDREAALDAVPGDAPAHIATRLLMLANPEPPAMVERLFAKGDIDLLLDLGVLERTGEMLRAAVLVLPMEEGLIVSDFNHFIDGRAMREDHVLGAGPATQILLRLVPRVPAARVLDLGVGQGVQSLAASDHAGRVIGTDLSPRALAAAALTARLNGRGNIELRRGDLYAPVAGETFDMVIANPPFLIVPPINLAAVTSTDGGDTLMERAARGAPGLLHDGGWAVLMASWHHRTPQDWAEKPRAWLEGCGCDAWIMHFDTHTPAECTMKYRREFPDSPLSRLPREDWLAYYARIGAAQVTLGAFVLRKRSGRNWMRLERASPDFNRPRSGRIVETIFENETFLSTHPREALLECRPTLEPTVEVEQRWGADPEGGLAVTSAIVRHASMLQMPLNTSASVLRVLTQVDGTRTLGEIMDVVADSMGIPREKLRVEGLPGLEVLAKRGFLRLSGGRASVAGKA